MSTINSVGNGLTSQTGTGLFVGSINPAINNISLGYATTVTSGTPIVLVAGSNYQQYLTGSTAQTVTMPVASTLGLGQSFLVVNDSSATTTVNSSGGNLIESLPAGSQAVFTVILASGTTAASWSSDFTSNIAGVASITGTANEVIASASTGAVTLSLPQSINTTAAVQFNTVQLNSASGLLDPNGLKVLGITNAPSAVNYVEVSNAGTGIGPVLEAAGTDTNVQLVLMGQGTSGVAIKGVTDASNASSGNVGQNLSSVILGGTPLSLTSTSAKNLTSVSLTAGDWLVWGNITFLPSNTTSVNTIYAWLAPTNSLSIPDDSVLSGTSYGTTPIVSSGGDMGVTCIPFRISLSTTTIMYINAVSLFSISTMTMCGGIYATRIR
jgi:hypothetical protein